RRSFTPLLGGQGGGALAAPVSPTRAGAPLLPGGGHADSASYPFSTPVLSGAARMSPLIRPAATIPVVDVALEPHGTPEVTALDEAPAELAAAPASLPTLSSRSSSVR
ncbi:zf-HC2 domain-containing protein, partial [Streptomyces sp. SID14478]|nr:zf-HC2 domain-containing protein [Streptomyces sp. SID14478]